METKDRKRLTEIEARHAAATPGPWTWENWHADYDPPEDIYALTAAPETSQYWGPDCMYPDLRHLLIDDERKTISSADRAFIANARTDVPWLGNELRKARNCICELTRSGHTFWMATCGHGVERATVVVDDAGKSMCPVCAEKLIRELQQAASGQVRIAALEAAHG